MLHKYIFKLIHTGVFVSIFLSNILFPVFAQTTTIANSCVCQSTNICSNTCTFNKISSQTYSSTISCTREVYLGVTPSDTDKNNYCNRIQRTLGDADGNGIVDSLDYIYYVRAVNGGIIPAQINPDFNGDGAVSVTDRSIVVYTLNVQNTTTTTPPPITTTTPVTGTWWKPTSSQPLHLHWQLSDNFVYPRDVVAGATVYDIDGELTSAATVASLHAMGSNIKVICYFDAGVYETYRSDASKFPSSVIGNADTGWNGSYWLDIRQTDILLPIMQARMQNWCKDKGFDAIEPDETEVWSNNPGFPITKDQNNYYNQQIAALAHSLNLSAGLKGNTSEIPDLYTYFDWTLNEQCWQYNECSNVYTYFSNKGKAAFNVEYKTNPNCTIANAQHMNSMKRDLNLVGPTNTSYLYQPCVPNSQTTW